MNFTRVWRGRECLSMEAWVAEGSWSTEGKKSRGDKIALLGITLPPQVGRPSAL